MPLHFLSAVRCISLGLLVLFHPNVLALLATTVPRLSLAPIEVKGYKFFDSSTGEEVLIRGIDYYPRPNTGKELNHNSMDLFTAEHRHIWERDIPYLQKLNVNAVRLYAVDPDGDHDAFMCAMEAAGIYVIVALAMDCPTCAITKDQAPDCYPPELKLRGQRVIQAFSKYSNTLAFSAGNEVNHFAPPNKPEWNAPCQKKFISDMRQYIASCLSMRNIPIGLISADNDRQDLAAYYNCHEDIGDSEDHFETAEWYGLNSYVFCNGKAKTYEDALALHLLSESFANLNYSIPVLLTEFGCLSDTFPEIDGYQGQRNFLEGKWLLTESEMRTQFQGGFAFEYSIEMENAKSESPYPFKTFGKQNYGVGYFEPENCDEVSIECDYQPFPEFDSLAQAFSVSKDQLNLTTIDSFEVTSTRKGPNLCPDRFPPLGSFQWKADELKNDACPVEQQYVCPMDYKELFRRKRPSRLGILSPRFSWMKVLSVGILVIALIFVLFRRAYQVAPPQRRMKGCEEATGLMSMKRFQNWSGDQSYQAINSGTSSRDAVK